MLRWVSLFLTKRFLGYFGLVGNEYVNEEAQKKGMLVAMTLKPVIPTCRTEDLTVLRITYRLKSVQRNFWISQLDQMHYFGVPFIYAPIYAAFGEKMNTTKITVHYFW